MIRRVIDEPADLAETTAAGAAAVMRNGRLALPRAHRADTGWAAAGAG